MISYPYVQAFLQSIQKDSSEEMASFRARAEAMGIPLIRRDSERLIQWLIPMRPPGPILELGSGTGFSAVTMAKADPQKARIDTIERDAGRCEVCRREIRAFGLEDRIFLHEGDALQEMKSLQGPYSFLFLDAAKGQYAPLLEEALPLMGDGALLVMDNLFHDGDLFLPKQAVSRRDRTIHTRMIEFLEELEERFAASLLLLPVGDGMAVVRLEKKNEGC